MAANSPADAKSPSVNTETKTNMNGNTRAPGSPSSVSEEFEHFGEGTVKVDAQGFAIGDMCARNSFVCLTVLQDGSCLVAR